MVSAYHMKMMQTRFVPHDTNRNRLKVLVGSYCRGFVSCLFFAKLTVFGTWFLQRFHMQGFLTLNCIGIDFGHLNLNDMQPKVARVMFMLRRKDKMLVSSDLVPT